jgi:AcrR family transcriptional regulator
MTVSPRASERSERRRREVCDAARRVIARNGLEVTTLRDISREGGFTTGVLSHHFPDKKAVIAGAFAAASEDWIVRVRESLGGAASAGEMLEALVRAAIPDDPERREEWRLWAEMWTYAGRHPEFAVQLVATDALGEAEIRAALESARGAGVIGAVDVDVEAAVLARLIDGLGLRAWLSGRWAEARRLLVRHLATLGVTEPLLGQMLNPPGASE